MPTYPGNARFAAIFVSQRAATGHLEYSAAAARMVELAQSQPGFVQIESVRGEDGRGITVSYWDSLEAIQRWAGHAEHVAVQVAGRERWYEWFDLAITRIERRRVFTRSLENESENIQGNHQQHQTDDKK